MRKTLIALVILTLSFGVVGCTSDKEETTSNSKEVVTQEESKEEKKRSSDEMYELYLSKVEEVGKLLKENNIPYEEKNNNSKYNDITSIEYENSEQEAVNEFTIGRYGISFDKNDDIRYISSKLTLNVNDEEMKSKEFKFEDTEFYKLHNILAAEVKNNDEINEKVNATYKKLTSIDRIVIENGKVRETIVLGDNCIDYTILIMP